MSQNRQLAAIMFTDIEGYTALMQNDEKNAIDIRFKHREIFKSVTEKYQGELIQYYGDGTLSTFKSSVEAIKCSIEMQRVFQKEPAIPVRIGIHVGDIIRTESDIIGDAVNIASRVESLAVAGSVLISDKVNDQLRNQNDINTKFLDVFEFKNVDQPMPIFAIVNEGMVVPKLSDISGKIKEKESKSFKIYKRKAAIILGFLIAVIIVMFFYSKSNFEKTIPNQDLGQSDSIDNKMAVLPFLNTKPDTDTDYLGFALADQIIGGLIYIKDISIKPSSSIRKFEGNKLELNSIAEELKVDYLLIGNYLKEGDVIRLNIELINTNTNTITWREPLEINFQSAFELQDIVSKKVVEELKLRFSQTELNRITKSIPVNPLAFEYYLRSISYPLINTGDQLAIEMLKNSIELDSLYAPSYAELGFRIQRLTQFALKDPENTKLAEKYYLKALSINEELLSALGNLAMLYAEINKTSEAVGLTRKMLDINPNNASAHFSLGYIYRYAGMLKESIQEMEKAISLDPKNPRYSRLGVTYMNVYEYDKAIEAFDVDKGSAYSTAWQGVILFHQRKFEKAVERFNEVLSMESEPLWQNVSTAFKASIEGNTEIGLYAMKNLEDANIADSEALYYWGSWYGMLGDKDACLRSLKRAVDGGYFNYPYMQSDPFLDFVRDNTEFQAVLKKAKLRHEGFKKEFFLN